MKQKSVKSLGFFFLCSVFMLGACGASGNGNGYTNQNKETASNKLASIEIEDGTYVVPEGETPTEDTGYLALNIKIKNTGKDTLSISTDDINLYDEDDNKISQVNDYTDSESFKKLKYESLSGDKNTTGYVIFKVDKEKKYELHYAPMSYSDEKQKDIQLDVVAKDYKDNSSDVTKLTEEFVNAVFLNKKSEETNKNLANNLEEEHNSFNKTFSQSFGKEFTYYKPSEAELMTAIDAFEATNAKKAKTSYSIKSFYPEEATVYVKTETIHFDSLDTDTIIEDFVNKNEGKYSDYDKAQSDAEKYLLEQLPTKYESASVNTNDSSIGEGYEVHLTKKDDKWTIDTSDSSKNYAFNSLKQAFMGDLYVR